MALGGGFNDDRSADRRASRRVGGGSDDGGDEGTDDDRTRDRDASRRVGGDPDAADDSDTDSDASRDDEDDNRDRSDRDDDRSASRRTRSTDTEPETSGDDRQQDQQQSERVGGSGNAQDEPAAGEADAPAGTVAGAGGTDSPFAEDRAAAKLDEQTESDVRPDDVVVEDNEARLDREAQLQEQEARANDVVESGSDRSNPGVGAGETGEQQGRLEEMGETFDEEITEPAGDAVRTVTPAAAVERRVTGTDAVGSTVEGATEGAVSLLNVPANVAATRDLGQAAVDTSGDVLEPVSVGPVTATAPTIDQEAAEETGEQGVAVGAAVGQAAAESPFETGGRAFGAGAAGVAGSRAAVGVSRRASRVVDADDLDQFVRSDRAQLGAGRRSTDTDIEQDTIAVERTVGREADDVDIEDRPGIEVQRPDDRITQDDQLARVIEDAADDVDDTATQRDLSARERADQQLPPAREFESPEARQRELEQLTQRFRQQQRTDTDVDADTVAQQQAAAAATAGTAGQGSAELFATGQQGQQGVAVDAAAGQQESIEAVTVGQTAAVTGVTTAQAQTGDGVDAAATELVTEATATGQLTDTGQATTTATTSDATTTTSVAELIEPTTSTVELEEDSEIDEDLPIDGFDTEAFEFEFEIDEDLIGGEI